MVEAIITGIVGIVVCMINNFYQSKRTEATHQSAIDLIIYRIGQLEKKQDLHNNAVERLYLVEKKLSVDEEKISVANHRINDLENMNS